MSDVEQQRRRGDQRQTDAGCQRQRMVRPWQMSSAELEAQIGVVARQQQPLAAECRWPVGTRSPQ